MDKITVKDFITFKELSDTGKTKVFSIIANKSEERIGTIKFAGAVKSYAFNPVEGTFFDKKNLGDILDFLNLLSADREKPALGSDYSNYIPKDDEIYGVVAASYQEYRRFLKKITDIHKDSSIALQYEHLINEFSKAGGKLNKVICYGNYKENVNWEYTVALWKAKGVEIIEL